MIHHSGLRTCFALQQVFLIQILWLLMMMIMIISTTTTTITMAFPMQIVISQHTNECLYEQLELDERVTLSSFLLAGAELKATLTFDGPLPEEEQKGNGISINSGTALQQSIRLLDQRGGHHHNEDEEEIHFSDTIDFEHLNIGMADDHEGDILNEDRGEDSIEEETAEQRRERRMDQRKKVLEARQRQERHKIEQRRKIRHEGEPMQWTFQAPNKGWYRYCIRATWNQVTVEMDIRKESEMGGIDENGNVFTMADKIVSEEERYMEEDTAEKEGIKDEDFESTRTKLKELRHLLADIQSKQSQERHRITLHSVTNSHSHSRMVLGSLIETIMFMLVTGYQVYTIRKWFKGAPVLAR